MADLADREPAGASPTTVAPAAAGAGVEFADEPSAVVLEEQRAGLRALGSWSRSRADLSHEWLPEATVDPTRVMMLGLQVVAEAVIAAEAECHRILVAAERDAAEIVERAHDEVAGLTPWRDGDAVVDESEPLPAVENTAPDLPPPTFPPPTFPPPTVSPPAFEPAAGPPMTVDNGWRPEEAGADFFASGGSDSDDRWNFLDDENLVGAGPLVRRLLRRPTGWREE